MLADDVSAEVIDFPSDEEVELVIDTETGESSVENEDDEEVGDD